ncbi:MAG: PDZ domain-containing protein, partial [Tannerellaceae bacterium]
MKRVVLSMLLMFAFLGGHAQSKNGSICRLGITYEISRSPNWGKNRPIVTGILPYTPAEQAGIKPGDLIDEIDGVLTTDVSSAEIPQLLNPAGKNEVLLTIRNLANTAKQVLVRKDCKRSNAITEDQLAAAFSMYSTEYTSDRIFACPFKTTVTTDSVNFGIFKTFAFAAIDENNSHLETIINDCIEKELVKKGLKLSLTKPDLLIQTFYFFDKNPNYKGKNKVVMDREPTYRYNFTVSKMEKFPFLSNDSAESEAEYLLQYGFRLVDQRRVPGRIIWECEANELMEESYRLDEYARIHTPLMCMQYPYVKYTRNMQYRVNQKTYNYTGISYDIDRLELVADVNRNSPAYAAGIRPKDIIEKIGDHRMNHSAEEFSAAYKQFITKTMSCRDAKTQFTDANGFKRCMFWDTFKYPQVADAIQNTNYMAAFSYLYF